MKKMATPAHGPGIKSTKSRELIGFHAGIKGTVIFTRLADK
jgi:hypothetical protein